MKPELSPKNRRLLVIDDNRAIHEDFRKILLPATGTTHALDAAEMALFGGTTVAAAQTVFEVASAYEGVEGVSMVDAALRVGRPYAMAFVDVRMPPGLDGVETTQRIWALDPGIQIVICTAYADYSWNEMFEKIGECDGLVILKKPFDAMEALQLAHALTKKWSLHQQSMRKMDELDAIVRERTRAVRTVNAQLAAANQNLLAESQRANELAQAASAGSKAKDDYISKPAKLEEIKKLLPGHGSSRFDSGAEIAAAVASHLVSPE